MAKMATAKQLKQQQGFTLIEMLFVLTFMSVITAVGFLEYKKYQDNQNAKDIGAYLAQYNSAVRSFLSWNGANSIAASGCAPVGGPTPCVIAGTDWLKINDGTCGAGTSLEPHLSCAFPDSILGIIPSTQLFTSAGGAEHAVTYMGTFVDGDGQVRNDLSVLAAAAANAQQPTIGYSSVTGGGTPLAGTAFYQYYSFNTAFGDAWGYNVATEATQPNNGELIAEANTAPSLDSWLRTDGSNGMQGDLDMNGNDINNVGTMNADTVNADTVNTDNLNVGGVDIYDSLKTRRTEMLPPGSIIPKPTCPTGQTPQIYLAPSLAAIDGATIHGFDLFAEDNGATWTTNFRAYTGAGWMDLAHSPSTSFAEIHTTVDCIEP